MAFGWDDIIGLGVGGLFSLFGSKKAADSNTKAAEISAKAIEAASQREAEAAERALAFEKEQAANSRADNIAAQLGNFGQWTYRQNNIRPYQGTGLHATNTLSQLLGLPAINTTLQDLPGPPQFAGQANAAAPQGDPTLDAYVMSLTEGKTPGSETLIGLEPELAKKGIKVLRNASGIAGKVQYPSGEIVDVGRAFSSGNPKQMAWQILRGSAQPAGPTFGTMTGFPPVARPLGSGQALSVVPGSLGSLVMG